MTRDPPEGPTVDGVPADSTPFRVRPATVDDLGTLLGLQSHLPEPAPSLLRFQLRTAGDDRGAGGDRNHRSYGADGTDGAALAATTATGRVVGYLLAVATGPVADAVPGDVYVAELAVDPAHRREGAATALLARLFASLPGDARVGLAVAPDNEPALSLYRGCGFEVAARREGFYDDGPALLLVRSVDG